MMCLNRRAITALLIGSALVFSTTPAHAVKRWKGLGNGHLYETLEDCFKDNNKCKLMAKTANPGADPVRDSSAETTAAARTAQNGASRPTPTTEVGVLACKGADGVYSKPPCKGGIKAIWVIGRSGE